MVSFLVFLIICISPISVTQEISYLDVFISGNISSFEVSEFSYEGIIVVDLRGNIATGASLERFVNSPLKEAEIKKMGQEDFRLVLKFSGPIRLVDKEISKRGLKIRVAPEVHSIQVLSASGYGFYSKVPSVSTESPSKVIKETLYVEKPIPTLLKCNRVAGSELSAFLQYVTGLKLNLKSDSTYNLFLRAGSKEELLRKLSANGR